MPLALVLYDLEEIQCILGVISAQLLLLAEFMIDGLKKDTPQRGWEAPTIHILYL